jgi:hypothetical protein
MLSSIGTPLPADQALTSRMAGAVMDMVRMMSGARLA